jgi:hypothetical protein
MKDSFLRHILRMKGFRHGSGNKPICPAHCDCTDYMLGFADGRVAYKKAHDRYAKELKAKVQY